jgi:hypothetical protein
MMATKMQWSTRMVINNIKFRYFYLISILPFNKARTKAINRVGPHNIDILSILICGMLGD